MYYLDSVHLDLIEEVYNSLYFGLLICTKVQKERKSKSLPLEIANLRFLEYYTFYKTKYLVDSFYIFLCPLAELLTLSSSMPLPYTQGPL